MPPNPEPVTRMIRTRKQDEFQAPEAFKRQCRQTTIIGETSFRCDRHHKDGLTTHHEAGIMNGKVKYEITWEELDTPLRIRNQIKDASRSDRKQ